jgi:hypothetical protein
MTLVITVDLAGRHNNAKWKAIFEARFKTIRIAKIQQNFIKRSASVTEL